MWKYCVLLAFLFASEPVLAQSTNDWLDAGMQAYERKQFVEAGMAFESYLQKGGDPKKIALPLSVTYYENSKLDEAHSLLSNLINDAGGSAALHYYAKVLHAKGNYAEAAEYYKKYLPSAEDPAHIKKQILHCRYGISLSAEKSLAFIDNMGEQINTAFDEMAPVISPNHPGRVYFSSASSRSEGGKRDPNGYKNEEFGHYTYDMFKVDNERGSWTTPQPLNPSLNTARHELLYGFTSSGRVAFFFRGFNLKFGEIVTDTFRTGDENTLKQNQIFNSPANASYGDKDLHFINDSAFLFASVRPEGLGGYDLYISKWENGIWTNPEPLGPEVNTPFHERCPHFNKDGNQLFFSSDRPQGFGGFDVFVAGWSNRKIKPAINLGKGVNSAGDDLFFVHGHDSYAAFFSSNRKSGIGGYDLYSAYFKEPIEEITASKGYPPFLVNNLKGETEKVSSEELANKEEISISSLLFSEDVEELTIEHRESLNKVAALLSEHTEIELNILSFTDYEGPRKYDLYFALQRAEKVGKYLIEKGISGDRIYITGCGSAYPVYLKLSEAQLNPSPNQRIDLRFSSPGGMPVDITYDPNVPIDEVENTPYQKFINLSKGLTFSVQIAATQQLYESPVLEKFANPLIRTKAGNPLIKYTIGIFDSYDEARNLRYQLLKEGYKGAFITAYIDGIRKTRDQLRPLVDQYDGLRAYINVE